MRKTLPSLFKFVSFRLLVLGILLTFQFLHFETGVANGQKLKRSCLDCICESSTRCNRSIGCMGKVCGPFKITEGYWIDAGKIVLDGDKPDLNGAFQRCTTDHTCAAMTVTSYVEKRAQDCNEDEKINCYDYALIHKLGGYGGCKKDQPRAARSYIELFQACIEFIEETTGTTSYD